MKKFAICVWLTGIFLLVGCEETKSVQWWTEHHDDALKKEVECDKSGSDTQNCRNIRESNFRWKQLHSIEPDWNSEMKKFIK